MATSNAFGDKKRPPGKEFRDGTVGEALDDLYSDIEEAFVETEGASWQVTLTVGVEAANAIPVGIQLYNRMGATITVGGPVMLKCTSYSAAMQYDIAVATLAETGTGTEVSTTAMPGLLILTDASGAAEVTMTDATGVLAGDLYLEVVPVSDGISGGIELGAGTAVGAIATCTYA
jgi:hypothetical protein